MSGKNNPRSPMRDSGEPIGAESHPPAKWEIVVQRRILHTIAQYNLAHGPMPMQILSAKFSKMCMSLGGFPEFLMDLEAKGLVLITIQVSGKQLVSTPVVSPPKVTAAY